MTTKAFLSHSGLVSLRDLPDFEALEDAGLLSEGTLLAEEIPIAQGDGLDDNDTDDLGSPSSVFD